MRLIIMRHGQAVNTARTDAERALTDKGHRDARRIGNWLIASGYRPGQVLVSPYLRARETAAEVLSLSGWPAQQADWITPEDDPAEVVLRLSRYAEDTLMLVSHQPLVNSLLQLLVDERAAAGIAFTPATVVVLDGDMIAYGAMQVVAVRNPEDI